MSCREASMWMALVIIVSYLNVIERLKTSRLQCSISQTESGRALSLYWRYHMTQVPSTFSGCRVLRVNGRQS